MPEQESGTPVSEQMSTPAEVTTTNAETEIVDLGEDLPPELKTQTSDTQAEKEAKREARKKYELMVNGKKREVEVDFDNDEDVKRYLQKAFAADEKFQEAALTRKQAEQLVEALRTDPLSILRNPHLGLDVKELATRILNDEIAEMEKSPEQKRLEELEAKLAEKEEFEKQLKEEKRQAEMQRIQAEAYKQLDDDITTALTNSDLPKSPYVLKRIADAMIEATELGYLDVRVQDIMPYVEQQVMTEIQQMFEAKPADVMEKLIGKKNLDSYRKSKISKVRTKPTEVQQMRDTGTKETSKKDDNKDQTQKKRFKDVFGTF